MRIDVKTDASIPGREVVARVVEAEVERALDPLSDSLLRVAVRLAVESGDGHRCTIEALAKSGTPITVTQRAPGVRPAVAAAVRQLASELVPARTRDRRR